MATDIMKPTVVIPNEKTVDYEVGDFDVTRGSTKSKLQQWINRIGAEETGVERIPESMRTNQSPMDLFTIFFSANCCTATMALGYLGPTSYGLGLADSCLCVLFFNLVGAIFPAVVARWGPLLGMRTMIVPRYSFGWWPAKILALLNALNQIGWGMGEFSCHSLIRSAS